MIVTSQRHNLNPRGLSLPPTSHGSSHTPPTGIFVNLHITESNLSFLFVPQMRRNSGQGLSLSLLRMVPNSCCISKTNLGQSLETLQHILGMTRSKWLAGSTSKFQSFWAAPRFSHSSVDIHLPGWQAKGRPSEPSCTSMQSWTLLGLKCEQLY